MGPSRFACVVALAALAGGCGDDLARDRADAREPGMLLGGQLTGRLGGEPFAVRYGHLDDWDGDWGARLVFLDGPVTCAGSYPDYRSPPAFHAWLEMDEDPESGQDRNGAHTIMKNSPRVVLEFESGQLHFGRVDEHAVSGTVAWGDDAFSLEGTFEVERCYNEYPGD